MIEQRHDSVVLYIKVIPTASRNEIIGLLGDRIKIKVIAPPEKGKANKAVCEYIAKVLGVSKKHVAVHQGETSQCKTILVSGMQIETVKNKLGIE